MKKLLFIAVFVFLSSVLFSEEVFIKEGDKVFKVTISENGDTLSKEEINLVNIEAPDTNMSSESNNMAKEEIMSKSIKEYNPQLLRIVPYEWQAGWYGAWQGFYYGFAITQGLGISEKTYAPVIWLSTPTLMFFLPPILIKDEVPVSALPIIDWGYRLGIIDYMLAKAAISDSASTDRDFLFSALLGYTESWGGYTLMRKFGPFRRAAGDFYGAGAFMGYLWGGLTGTYMATQLIDDNPVYNNDWFMDTLNWENDSIEYWAYQDSSYNLEQSREFIAIPTAMAFSFAFRTLGFYIGNSEKYMMKSFDGYLYSFNGIPGALIATEIYNYIDRKDEYPIAVTVASMATTALSGYIMKDTHFDDGNAVLMMIGGIVGGSLGQGIERAIVATLEKSHARDTTVYVGKVHTSIGAICMIAGELGVYLLRKESILSGEDFGTNMGLNLFPTNNSGYGAVLTFKF